MALGTIESPEDTQESAEKEEASGRVKLMTLHASKGLEFDTVFIIGVNPGLLPIRCSSFDQEEEERRLFFVGITRARNHLELSYYTNPGEPGVLGSYSNYLKMIPEELLEWKEIRSDEEKRTNLKELTRRAKEEIRKAEAQKAENVQEQKNGIRENRKCSGTKSDTSQIWNRYCDIGRRYDGRSRISKLRKETIYQGISGGRDDQVTEYIS